MRTSDAEYGTQPAKPMNKDVILSRIAVVAVTLGSLCLATTSHALGYPPLRTGANQDAPKATASPAKGAAPAKAGAKLSAADKSFMMNAAKGGISCVFKLATELAGGGLSAFLALGRSEY